MGRAGWPATERFRIVGEHGENDAFTRSPRAMVPQSFPRDQAASLFATLTGQGVRALHDRLIAETRSTSQSSGIHGYCPECEQMYCMQRYTVEEEWDESWFQGARGGCPRRHWRELA